MPIYIIGGYSIWSLFSAQRYVIRTDIDRNCDVFSGIFWLCRVHQSVVTDGPRSDKQAAAVGR